MLTWTGLHQAAIAGLKLALLAMLASWQASQMAQARPMDLVRPQAPVDFGLLYRFARLSSATYASKSVIRDRHPGVSWIATPGHTNVLYFVQTNHESRKHVVAVRGTVDDVNWRLDMDTHGAFDKKSGVLVHRGFHTVARTIYADLRGRLKPTYRTYFTGHSLGGAVSAILATYLDRDGYGIGGVYTFGQPKFTNAEGVRRYSYMPVLRVVYQNDAVAMLPDAVKGGRASYVHLGPEVVLLSGPYFSYLDEIDAARKSIGAFSRGITFTSLPDHKMKWYLQGIREKLKQSKAVPYSKRQRYVTRHKRGSGIDTAPAAKVTNFNRRAVY
jgi:triacylglycerol lipase